VAIPGCRVSSSRSGIVSTHNVTLLTGDYLAELTMLILWKARRKDDRLGYATTFLRQMQEVLAYLAVLRSFSCLALVGGGPDLVKRWTRHHFQCQLIVTETPWFRLAVANPQRETE
jgi:Acyclic terpene utilisation family protein AtuA